MSDQQNPPAAPTPAVAQEAAELEYGRILSTFDVEQKSDATEKRSSLPSWQGASPLMRARKS